MVEAGRYREALPALRAAAQAATRLHGPDSIETAEALNQLGVACKFAGRLDDAEAAYSRAHSTAERVVGTYPDLLATLLHNLAGLAHSRKQYVEAEAIARRGLALRVDRSRDARAIASDTAALAAIVEGEERWAEAEELYRSALAMWEVEGDDHEVAMARNGLAAVLRFSGRPADAEPLFREALATLDGELGGRHPDAATVRNNLAMLLNATGRAKEALALLEKATSDLDAVLGTGHPTTRDVRANRDRVSAALFVGRDAREPSGG